MQLKTLLTLHGLPRPLQAAIWSVVGVLVGVGITTAVIGRAGSYLSDKSETCINCHVMTDAYVSWQCGSHALVAKCNDCHVPQTNPVARWGFKALDGTKHSAIFSVHGEPQVLSLSSLGRPVVQANCLRCHTNVMQCVPLEGPNGRKCWDCHTNIHGKARSLSASPVERRPRLPDVGWHIGK